MRNAVEVRMSVSASVEVIAALAADPSTWAQTPGADVCLRVESTSVPDHFAYTIESGLPVRDHRGELALRGTGHGGTEVVFAESFRPRIWGTGGFLRGRRERVLIDTARGWDATGAEPTT